MKTMGDLILWNTVYIQQRNSARTSQS